MRPSRLVEVSSADSSSKDRLRGSVSQNSGGRRARRRNPPLLFPGGFTSLLCEGVIELGSKTLASTVEGSGGVAVSTLNWDRPARLVRPSASIQASSSLASHGLGHCSMAIVFIVVGIARFVLLRIRVEEILELADVMVHVFSLEMNVDDH